MRPTSWSLATPTRSTSSSVSFAHLLRTFPFSCSHFPFRLSALISFLLLPEGGLQRACHHAIQRSPVLAGITPGFHGLIDRRSGGTDARLARWVRGVSLAVSRRLRR